MDENIRKENKLMRIILPQKTKQKEIGKLHFLTYMMIYTLIYMYIRHIHE